MGKKTTNFNKTGINKLPLDKPVLYKIKTRSGDTNYAGTAKKGRAQERIEEHLGKIPGAKVRARRSRALPLAF